MAGEYEKAITIQEAIAAINGGDYLLPAIQRKFVWSSHQICVLFDSIMRGYPINSFMMWEVNSAEIKNDYKFYEFLKCYCQRFSEENPHKPTTASYKNFKAIIDGQQRLTSLYIGLCGTYAYKQPRVWWPTTRDDKLLPPRKLYLDLAQAVDSQDNESLMHYNFKFLTDAQYKSALATSDSKHHWFCLHDILKMPQVDGGNHIWNKVTKPYLEAHNLQANEFAADTLGQLYDVIRSQRIVHYFNESSQEIDHVLDVFIRTNSGGTKLDFSDLLMSIAVANWDGDFRQDVDGLIRQIHQSADIGFYMDRDWVLKACLVLIGADVRFKVKNFSAEQVRQIQDAWAEIRDCILETLRLIRRMGINSQSLTSKNAVIPICYYLYKKQVGNGSLFKSINNLSKHNEQRDLISRWFYMALLKGVFGGQADTILKSMRDVLDQHMDEQYFPLQQVVERYTATNKDLRFDDEYMESVLNIEHGEGRCRALLHLLFPEMNATEVFHIDHLHPRSHFDKKRLAKVDALLKNSERMDFYADSSHWNTIANLHLLNDSQNLSKSDRPLKEWLEDSSVHLTAANLLVEGVDLGFEDFPEFFAARRAALKERLKSRVYISQSIQAEPEPEDQDEEVVEDVLA
ncbi:MULTISPECIES: DUF262 domain-containing protein [Aeromonas]|uniref:DUF262 domain-containing protein n=1 Tax=Aeromonas TaxID=642 RepID=UPI001164A685|nr:MULTISPECIES: DUF262 domain-containing protein [Aeromonas]MDM5123555.1 DUF262 domain-containing protein [Aeromonas rivipollensis]QDO77237.1 DUF262 domain-containing protein [Aeromonas caviae]